MPRLYTVSFAGVLVSASQDLFQINGPTGSRVLRIRRAVLSSTNVTIPTSQMVQVQARFLPATVTNGTGGTAPTPARTDQGDAAPSFTSLVNNTGAATSSNTPVNLYQSGFHAYNGLDEPFDDANGNGSPVIGPGEAWVFQLLNNPTGTINFSGTVWVEEFGG